MNDMFYKSHMSGFGGIKQKYVQNKTVNLDKREANKYEKPEFSYTQTSYRNSATANSTILTEKRFSNIISSDKPKMVKNYLTKNIDLRDQLQKYRTMLNQQHPDPDAKRGNEESNEASSPTKVPEKKSA